jgi:hypothetical protein
MASCRNISSVQASAPERIMEAASQSTPQLINLEEVEGAFNFEEGFSRPAWRVISKAIQRKTVETIDLNAAWDEAVRQWLIHLQQDLGGEYQIAESRRFFLLASLELETRKKILSFAEETLTQIREHLQDAVWKPEHGKHAILLFAEDDDYYQYVSYFHRDGIHPTSGGCLIHKDYVHIAVPYEPRYFRQVLTHELTHNCVVHLHLPLWLNEGLAKMFQRAVATRTPPLLDHELRERHLAFWNEQNVQEFWAGISFQKPGDSNHLSYSLAEVIINLLLERRGNWGAFLKQAQWGDGGQTAALECLDVNLGNVMGTFLGEGDWRPRRKAMVALWEARKKAGEGEERKDG